MYVPNDVTEKTTRLACGVASNENIPSSPVTVSSQVFDVYVVDVFCIHYDCDDDLHDLDALSAATRFYLG